ncbi:MAG: RluA family pseudouridine synthase [Clostridia bacterium]|nr:RluA family pseudouridine synthase [Clostridia bacterium]
MRVYEAVVPPRAAGMRMDKYVSLAFSLLPDAVTRDAFSRRDVKADGKRTGKEALVQPGQQIRLYTDYDCALPAVYEDEHILLLNKPAGITCDADVWGGMTVLSLMAARAKGAYVPRLCHRLDHPTCGLLLLCKDDESEALLRDAFKERALEKIYQCLVRGEMRPPNALKEAYLVKDAERATVRVVTHATPGALPIATQYETLDFDGEISRLRVTLLTGRTHQIRAHMAFLSHPILGDDKYGDRVFNKRFKTTSLRLCATELTLHTEGCLAYLEGKHFSIEPPF